MNARQRILAALASEPVDRPPVWMMRQAGRYLPEYRALRKDHSFLECVRTPDLAAEITVQPIRRYGFDAAILFSDILTIPEALGVDVTFPQGGPRLSPTIDGPEDVEKLPSVDIRKALGYVGGAVSASRRVVGEETALLGFSGAPFTLACYMVEGAGSKSWSKIRAMVHQPDSGLPQLLDRLADAVIDYLHMQIDAGVDAVQLFDSWAGQLRRVDYERLVLPSTRRIIASIVDRGVPIILFARHPGHLLQPTLEAGATAVSLDWRVELADAVGPAAELGVALQGNLDPTELFASHDHIRSRIREMHAAVGGRTGHVFNLGHGVTPPTPLDGVGAFVDAVRSLAQPSSTL